MFIYGFMKKSKIFWTDILNGLSAKDMQSLSVSALLGKMALGADDSMKSKLSQLAEKAAELGIDSTGKKSN